MIGKRLKELRNKKGILQKELAASLQLTQQTISLYESDRREPDAETLVKMANLFNVSTDYLLGRTDDPSPLDKQQIKESRANYGIDVSDLPEETVKQIGEYVEFIRRKHSKSNEQ